MKNQVEEKNQIIEELKEEFIYDKSIHEEYTGDLKEENNRYCEEISALNKIVEKKSEEIEKLKG